MQSTTTLSERLKQYTQAEHQETEKLLINRIKSVRSNEDYIELLKIFYGYFAPLETLVRQHLTSKDLPDLHERRSAVRIEEDLKALGYQETLTLSTSLPQIENKHDAAGAMYVQEGSTLGGRHIARMISGKIDCQDAFSFFEGYNEKTDQMWDNFKSYLNQNVTTESEAIQVMDGAKQTFAKMKEWISINEI